MHLVHFAKRILEWNTPVRCMEIQHTNFKWIKLLQRDLEGVSQSLWGMITRFHRKDPLRSQINYKPRKDTGDAHFVSTVAPLRSNWERY